MKNEIYKKIKNSKEWELYNFHTNFKKYYTNEFKQKLLKIVKDNQNIVNLKEFYDLDISILKVINFLKENITNVNASRIIGHSKYLYNETYLYLYTSSKFKNNFKTINLIEQIYDFIHYKFNEFTLENYYSLLESIEETKLIIDELFEEYEKSFNSLERKEELNNLIFRKGGYKKLFVNVSNFLIKLNKIENVLKLLEIFMDNIFKVYIDKIFQFKNKKYIIEMNTKEENSIVIYLKEGNKEEIIIKEIIIELIYPFIYNLKTNKYTRKEWIEEKKYEEYPKEFVNNTIEKLGVI